MILCVCSLNFCDFQFGNIRHNPGRLFDRGSRRLLSVLSGCHCRQVRLQESFCLYCSIGFFICMNAISFSPTLSVVLYFTFSAMRTYTLTNAPISFLSYLALSLPRLCSHISSLFSSLLLYIFLTVQ